MALNLPLLPNGQAIVTPNGIPTLAFTLYWQQVLEAVETAFNALEDAVNAIAAAQAAADTANAAAATANAAAATAQAAAIGVTEASALSNSWVSTLSLTAEDVGTDVTVTVPAHTRYYPQPDGSTVDVAVDGGTIAGLTYSTGYYIYYDQPTREGGAVAYQATTSATDAAQVGARHVVGSILTPAAAAPPSSGGGVRPPGSGGTKEPTE